MTPTPTCNICGAPMDGSHATIDGAHYRCHRTATSDALLRAEAKKWDFVFDTLMAPRATLAPKPSVK